jgi:hypothetical protein
MGALVEKQEISLIRYTFIYVNHLPVVIQADSINVASVIAANLKCLIATINIIAPMM